MAAVANININHDVREFLLSLDDSLSQLDSIQQLEQNTIERNQRRIKENLKILNIFISLLLLETVEISNM